LDRLGAQTPHGLRQKIPHAAWRLAGQQDQHPVTRRREGGHADLKKIDGERLIGQREVKALGRPTGP
jgi:hypothetical protein